jgi:23S rRNA (cytosine1962-C5)-methyltransferase
VPPCILFEDEHLLVTNKPAGMNTHAPSPFAGEGIYDWLRHCEPRWAKLAIIHRLDKETSGVMVFGKSTLANRSLTEQFANRQVHKKYLLLTDRSLKRDELVVKSKIARAGERYASGAQGELAETRFAKVGANVRRLTLNSKKLKPPHVAAYEVIEAEPLTGRTHQIRVHAAESGFPILGDILYGGTAFSRVCLHAAEIKFQHPATAQELTFRAPVDFASDSREALRAALIEPEETNAFRVVHGASDGWPGWYVDRLGGFLLSQSEAPLTKSQHERLAALGAPGARSASPQFQQAEQELGVPIRGAYHKILSRHVRGAGTAEASPQLIFGEAAPERFTIRENGIEFELSFNEGYSVGLFLDQRDNRRRLLTGHTAADFPLLNSKLATRNSQPELLNVFAYTCGFSVCAAKAGMRTTSLDLSKKYLEWGRRNFALNGLDPAEHDFIFGDAFDWMRRLAKKGRAFDVIVLDPPTFSQSKERGTFRAEKNYGELVTAALSLLRPKGVLLASTNAADWAPEKFLATVERSVRAAKRKILKQHYAPQPPDFPVSRNEPAYLKTVWTRVA